MNGSSASHAAATVRVLTLGCSKNIVSSEVLCTQLRDGGFTVLHHDSQEVPTDTYADAVIVNTCGFIALAKEESVEGILKEVAAKKEGRVGKLYVVGCLSQRYRGGSAKRNPRGGRLFWDARPHGGARDTWGAPLGG